MIVAGGNTWKSTLGRGQVTRLVAEAHQNSALENYGRERAEDIQGWIEPLSESLIRVAAPRSIRFVDFPFKYGEDGFRRVAACYLNSEWVGSQVFAGLVLILFQGLFEDWLKVWSG
jgi:hypothetical protein